MMSETQPRATIRAARAAAGLLFLLSTAAEAQSQEHSPGPKRDLIVTIGGGPQFVPKYPGSDELALTPMPLVSFRRVGDPIDFTAADQGAGIGVLGSKSAVDFGPVVQAQGARRDKDVGVPIGKVGFTIEAGAFVQAWLGSHVRLRAEGRRGLGGHRAWVGDLSADLVVRNGDQTIFSVGPRLRVGDGRYQRTYFGVTPAAALATGLPAYRPGGGIFAAGLSSSLTHQFNDKWGMRAYGGYDRLVDDAADSPLVRRYGSRDQFSGGLGLTYSFRVKRGGN
jgi:outer membrane protein